PISGKESEGHIRGMAVHPDWQGQRGVAHSLLAAAEEHLRAAGCKRASLDTTAPLERDIRFYTNHGYRASGKVGDFFGMPLYEYVKEFRRSRACNAINDAYRRNRFLLALRPPRRAARRPSAERK